MTKKRLEEYHLTAKGKTLEIYGKVSEGLQRTFL